MIKVFGRATSSNVQVVMWTLADKELEGKAFLGGEELSFADIMFGHILYRYFTLDFERLPLGNLKAYYNRLVKREAYRKHIMVDYSALQVN